MLAEHFFAHADTANTMLSIAVDTLRQRNEKNNFIQNFIKDRGYPVWDAASAFYQVGLPVMLVPVKRPAQKKVSGILFLTMNNTRPVYRWIPRSSDYDGSAFLSKKELEEFMLMFEQKLFGEVQTPGIKVEVREEVGVDNHGKKEDNVSGIVITTSNCGRTSASNGASWGAWQCDFGIYWVRAIDSGSGGSDPGGFGGSGGEIPGGGSPLTDEEKTAAELKALLEINELALLDVPCEEIPKWQELGQFTPPQSVIDKIANLDDNYTSIISGDWNIQYIQDASGAVINMDYFPVTVSQLPDNPNTGQRFTADGFLEYIRTNLDNFFDGNSTEFGPYNSTENQIWQSDNYLGATMRFDIYIEVGGIIIGQQDGSVISSDQSEQSWNFTTIESPADWNHPVSGTRKFGYTQNGDGSYTFYIRGVDRIAEYFDEFVGNYGPANGAFEGADALWNTFKDGVYGFVENHGGNARQPETNDNSIWRPNWDDVSDIIMNTGGRTVSDLGCN